MNKQIIILTLATLTLAACGSAPQRPVETRGTPAPIEDRTSGTTSETPAPPVTSHGGGYLAGDGPSTKTPENLDEVPDAVPNDEPLHRYANRPYVALNKTYTPLTKAENFKERGIASWYGKKFHGKPTASGEIYDMYVMTAAHPTLPIPSYARVTNVANQKSVVVRINDRGPFLHGRVIDLSYAAAHKLNIISVGTAEIEIESLTPGAMTVAIAPDEPVESKPLEETEAGNSTPIAASTSPAANSNVYLQLGAFKSQDAAEQFMAKMRTELGEFGKLIELFIKDGLVRVHLGPYASQNEARNSAESLQSKLGFKPLLNLH